MNRHPGSASLWREYLSYTASVKASKRWRKTMTNALRMMPTDPGLWVIAGRRSAANGDMVAARGFFMRGCRFCSRDCTLWIEYAGCEMEWLRKMEKKKGAIKADTDDRDHELRLIGSDEDEDDNDGALLPEPSKAQAKVLDKQATQQLVSNPAMDGAIPMAIFDISQKQPFFDASTAELFFEMIASFRDVSVQARISQHVLDTLDLKYPDHPSTCNCHVRQPIIGLSPDTADFARGLRDVLPRLEENLETTTDKEQLKTKTAQWIDDYLAFENLDEALRKVLEHTKTKLGLS